MYKEKILNLETGETTWRDYTPKEIAQVEQAEQEAALRLAEIAKRDAEKQLVLAKLGITEEEAKLLLI